MPFFFFKYSIFLDNILFPLIAFYFLISSASHGRVKAGRPARTYVQQLCADTGCSLEDLPGTMDDREGWRERVREIRAGGATR